jgi:hypothetical protein
MDTIESLSKGIIEIKAIISNDSLPAPIINKYKLEIMIYEAKKAFLLNFGD